MESDNGKWAYRAVDEFRNDWTWPIATPDENEQHQRPSNILRKAMNSSLNEDAFTYFDFTLMTNAEIEFLHRLANGIWPYESNRGRPGNNYLSPGETDTSISRIKSKWTKEELINCLNWTPIYSELYPDTLFRFRTTGGTGKFDEQVEAYNIFYSKNLDSKKFGIQKPQKFFLNWARRNLKGPFSLKSEIETLEYDEALTKSAEFYDAPFRDYTKIGNLDDIIRTGIVPFDLLSPEDKLNPNNTNFTIHPRELVYYIRRKYGISTTENQKGTTLNNELNSSDYPDIEIQYFRKYSCEFLFRDNNVPFLIGWTYPAEYSLSAQAFKGKKDLLDEIFQERQRLSEAGAARTLNAAQIESQTNDLNEKQDNIILTYNSLNTQRMEANRRARYLLRKFNEFGEVIYRGLEAKTISLVAAKISKKGDEPKDKNKELLSKSEIENKEQNLTPTSLILRNKENEPLENDPIFYQFISNIADPRPGDLDYKYHQRPWNKKGYVVDQEGGISRDETYGLPLFQEPEYRADYYEDSDGSTNCSPPDLSSKYYMRNIIKPDVSEFTTPPKEGNQYYIPEFGDLNQYAVNLTYAELSSIGIKYNSLIDNGEKESALTNRQYRDEINLVKNIDDNGNPILSGQLELSNVERIRYLQTKDILDRGGKSIYKLKKDLNKWMIGGILVLEHTHWLLHTLEHPSEIKNLAFRNLAIGGQNLLGGAHHVHHYAHFIHNLTLALEIPIVIFKVVSAIAQVSMYGDTASYITLAKELALGSWAIESLGGGISQTGVSTAVLARFLGVSTTAAGSFIALIIVGISLYVDAVTSNVRHSDKQKKFKKLLKKAHEKGYLEGPYAESAGSIIIEKKDVLSITQGTKSSNGQTTSYPPTQVTNTITETEYITSFEELMGSKGQRLFWDRIRNNPIECKTLLEIANRQESFFGVSGTQLLDKSPSKLEVGWFTNDEANSANGKDSVFQPFYYQDMVIYDKITPYIWGEISFKLYKLWLSTNKQRGLLPALRYSRSIITSNTSLEPYLNGTKPSTEFVFGFGDLNLVNVGLMRISDKLIPIEIANSLYYYDRKPLSPRYVTRESSNREPSSVLDIEKVRLIRKKYGLDLINPSEPGRSETRTGPPCCKLFTSTIEGTGVNLIKEIDGIGTDEGKLSRFLTKYGRRCDYKVPFNNPEFIAKLKEVCGGRSETSLQYDTTRNKIKRPLVPETPPVVYYDKKIDDAVVNDEIINYVDVMSSRVNPNAMSGTGVLDPINNLTTNFQRKSKATDEIDLNPNPITTTSISTFLVGILSLDLDRLSDIINTVATAYRGTFGDDRPTNDVYFGALENSGNEILNGGPQTNPIDNTLQQSQSSPIRDIYRGPNVIVKRG